MKTVPLFFVAALALLLGGCAELPNVNTGAAIHKQQAPTDVGAYITAVYVLNDDAKAVYLDKKIITVCFESKAVDSNKVDLLFMCWDREGAPDFIKGKIKGKSLAVDKQQAVTGAGVYVVVVHVLNEDAKAVYLDKSVAIVCFEPKAAGSIKTDVLYMCWYRDSVPDSVKVRIREQKKK